MNFGFLLFVTALLFNGSMSIDQSSKDRKRLADLNPDVLSLIFDEMSIEDMMNLLDARLPQSLVAAAKNSFYRRYKDYEVKIGNWPHLKRIRIIDLYKFMELPSEEIAPNVLRVLGDVIQRLTMRYPTKTILQLINKYASDSLTELSLRFNSFVGDDTIQTLTNSFKRVKVLELKVTDKFNPGNLTFIEMFPNIRELNFEMHSYDVNCSFFVGKFEHLQHLALHSYAGQYHQFKNWLIENSQIRCLGLSQLTSDISDTINEHLPNVEALEMLTVATWMENPARFENIKDLQISEYCKEPLDLVTFSRLESLRIFIGRDCFYSTRERVDRLTEFFGRHSNVSRFETSWKFFSENGNYLPSLLKLMNELPHMTEFTLEMFETFFDDFNVSFDILRTILQNNVELVKFHLLITKLSDWQIEMLQKQFKNEWHIKKFDRKVHLGPFTLTFEKLN